MIIEQSDNIIKKQKIGLWLHRSAAYRKKRAIAGVLYSIALLIILFTGVSFAHLGDEKSITAGVPLPVLGILTGAIVALIPFVIAHVMMIQAKKRYGKPFISRNNEFYQLTDAAFCYGFHDSDDSNNNSMNVYRILYHEIQRVTFDDEVGIMVLIGQGELTFYDDLLMTIPDETAHKKSFFQDSDYQIMITTTNPRELVEQIIFKIQEGRQ